MMAVVGVDPQLVDDLKSVLAPVLDVDQGVVQGDAVVPLEAVAFPQHPGGTIDVRGHDGVQQAMELAIRQLDVVEGLEVPTKVVLQSGTVSDVRPVSVFEITQLLDQGGFDVLFGHGRRFGSLQARDKRRPERHPLTCGEYHPESGDLAYIRAILKKNPNTVIKRISILSSS